jgi:putative endonuclease
MKTGYVYILECSDRSFYTGITNSIERRLAEHEEDEGITYVSKRRPFKLIWISDELVIQDAIVLEKQVKGWRRDKKMALINENYDQLPDLSTAYCKRK